MKFKPDKFQFSLCQFGFSGAAYVLGSRSQTEIGPIRCEQSDTCLTNKVTPQFLFLQIQAHCEVP